MHFSPVSEKIASILLRKMSFGVAGQKVGRARGFAIFRRTLQISDTIPTDGPQIFDGKDRGCSEFKFPSTFLQSEGLVPKFCIVDKKFSHENIFQQISHTPEFKSEHSVTSIIPEVLNRLDRPKCLRILYLFNGLRVDLGALQCWDRFFCDYLAPSRICTQKVTFEVDLCNSPYLSWL